jgi:hypothetical protein
VPAKNWYDGAYIYNAKEDAAHVALERLQLIEAAQQPTERDSPTVDVSTVEVNTASVSSAADDEEWDEWDTEESESSEEIWVSDFSEDSGIMEKDHPRWTANGNGIVNTIVFAFQQHQCRFNQATVLECDSNAKNGAPNNQKFDSRSSQKRSYSELTVADENGSSSSPQTSSNGRRLKKEIGRRFACPFCKKDSLRHRACYSVKLSKISYVKQHLSRDHYCPIYCSVCMERFDSESERDIHNRARACQSQPLVDWGAVTQEQKQKLRRKPPKNSTEEEQWYIIYEVLFPGHPRPSSPYIDYDLTEQIFAFQNFALAQGADIVRTVIPESERSPFLERVISEGIPAIIEQYLASRSSQHQQVLLNPRPEPRIRNVTPLENNHRSTASMTELSLNSGRDEERNNNGQSLEVATTESTFPQWPALQGFNGPTQHAMSSRIDQAFEWPQGIGMEPRGQATENSELATTANNFMELQSSFDVAGNGNVLRFAQLEEPGTRSAVVTDHEAGSGQLNQSGDWEFDQWIDVSMR